MSIRYCTVLHRHIVKINDVFLVQMRTDPDWPSLCKPGLEAGSSASGRSACHSFRHQCRFFCYIAKYAFVKTPCSEKWHSKNNGADEKNNFVVMSLTELTSCTLFASGVANFFL